MMIDLNNVKRVHFIGIAGAGMRAIANIFIEKGYDVSGSDLKSSPSILVNARKISRMPRLSSYHRPSEIRM